MGIAERLIEERERLGLSQTAFAALASLTGRAQRLYEKGERHPDAKYLAAIAAAGADVLYILTGQRAQPVAPQELLPAPDRILLDNFHHAPPEVQRGVATALGAFAPKGAAVKKKRGDKAA